MISVATFLLARVAEENLCQSIWNFFLCEVVSQKAADGKISVADISTQPAETKYGNKRPFGLLAEL